MRFSTEVYFQQITPGEYDPNTGNYADDKVTEIKRYASVTTSGVTTMNLIYGKILQGSLTVRIQDRLNVPAEYLRIDQKIYRIDFRRFLAKIDVFVVSEVQ